MVDGPSLVGEDPALFRIYLLKRHIGRVADDRCEASWPKPRLLQFKKIALDKAIQINWRPEHFGQKIKRQRIDIGTVNLIFRRFGTHLFKTYAGRFKETTTAKAGFEKSVIGIAYCPIDQDLAKSCRCVVRPELASIAQGAILMRLPTYWHCAPPVEAIYLEFRVIQIPCLFCMCFGNIRSAFFRTWIWLFWNVVLRSISLSSSSKDRSSIQRRLGS